MANQLGSANEELTIGPFIVQAFDTSGMSADQLNIPYERRSLYKISLYTGGTAQVQYHGHTLAIDRPSLMFFNPLVPYSCRQQRQLTGFSCEFTEGFLRGINRTASVQESPLFHLETFPLFPLDAAQAALVSRSFWQMMADMGSDYRHKYELLHTHVQLVVHTALRLRDAPPPAPVPSNAGRLAAQFLHLLEQQFPVTSPAQQLPLRTPQAFAARLHVHVNHLNRAVREITGRTTSAHLAGRIAREAQALLQHTDWPITTIADCLGFAEATYFTHFFRKQAGTSPLAFRQQGQ